MKSHPWITAAVLALAGAAIFLPALGQENSVTDREARHAEIARTMAMTGDYAVPRLFGAPYHDKPPLFNWSVAALFKLTGRTDFAVARLPSALCSIAAMLGIYCLGRRWLSARAGAYAALIWATSWLVVEWGRFCQMDVMMTCLILYAVLLADAAAAQKGAGAVLAAWLGACALVAAATMSKGPPALLYFFVGAACAWRARHGRWRPLLFLFLIAAIVTTAAWAAWLLPAEAEHPGHLHDLWKYQFGQGPTDKAGRVTLYFDQLLLRTAPWSLFAVGAAWWSVRRIRRYGYDLAAAPAVFLLVCLAIMTLVPSKREHYLLPVLPMWSLLIGSFLDRTLALRESQIISLTSRDEEKAPGPVTTMTAMTTMSNERTSCQANYVNFTREGGEEAREGERTPGRLFEWPLRLCLALFLAGAAALAGFWCASTGRGLAGGIILCAALAAPAAYGLAAASGLAAYGLGADWRPRSGRSLAMLFSISLLLMATAYPLTLAVFNPPMRNLVELRRAAQTIPAGAPVADLDVRSSYLCFKLNRQLAFVGSAEEAARFLDGPGRRFLLISSTAAGKVQSMAESPVRQAGPFEIGTKSPMVVLEAGDGVAQPPAAQ